MLAQNNISPLINWSLGFSVHLRFFLKKINIIGKTITTVKKYLDQVICNTGNVELKYFAKLVEKGDIKNGGNYDLFSEYQTLCSQI